MSVPGTSPREDGTLPYVVTLSATVQSAESASPRHGGVNRQFFGSFGVVLRHLGRPHGRARSGGARTIWTTCRQPSGDDLTIKVSDVRHRAMLRAAGWRALRRR